MCSSRETKVLVKASRAYSPIFEYQLHLLLLTVFLPFTGPDALPLSYKRLMRAKATGLPGLIPLSAPPSCFFFLQKFFLDLTLVGITLCFLSVNTLTDFSSPVRISGPLVSSAMATAWGHSSILACFTKSMVSA